MFDVSLGHFGFLLQPREPTCPEGISSFVTRGNTSALGACRQGSRKFTAAKLESRGGLNDPKFFHLFSDELLTCCSHHPRRWARPRENMRLENWYSEGFWFFLLQFAPSYIEWECFLKIISTYIYVWLCTTCLYVTWLETIFSQHKTLLFMRVNWCKMGLIRTFVEAHQH